MTDTHTQSRLPIFTSIQQEAEFWDTHDTTDYEDEFRPAQVEFAKNLSKVVSVRLDDDTMTALENQAHQQGIGLTTLIRMWVLQRLHDQTHHHALR